ncbi:MAG: hypothetical protein U9Q34_07055 [Elusimicrobiota bacterium]|nr:hypothetical protein [Elusimicrobiota bacterium]
MKPIRLFVLLSIFLLSISGNLFAKEKATTFELQLDPYYSAIGVYNSLTGKPIPHLKGKSETEIYKRLLSKFYLPRTLILEASINPLPYAGTLIRKHHQNFYNDAQLSESLNLVKSITAGFEEPWAFSIFLGNVVSFDSIKSDFLGKRKGYSGLLLDLGNKHIKDNILIDDNWAQMELKLKGEQILKDRSLTWSFRVGSKFHEHKDIEDSFFVGFRRSRTDFKESGNFWMNNSGFTYASYFSQTNLKPIKHIFIVDKKFPFKKSRKAFCLGLGFVWESNNKYSGNLATQNTPPNFQFLIRPNLEF